MSSIKIITINSTHINRFKIIICFSKSISCIRIRRSKIFISIIITKRCNQSTTKITCSIPTCTSYITFLSIIKIIPPSTTPCSFSTSTTFLKTPTISCLKVLSSTCNNTSCNRSKKIKT